MRMHVQLTRIRSQEAGRECGNLKEEGQRKRREEKGKYKQSHEDWSCVPFWCVNFSWVEASRAGQRSGLGNLWAFPSLAEGLPRRYFLVFSIAVKILPPEERSGYTSGAEIPSVSRWRRRQHRSQHPGWPSVMLLRLKARCYLLITSSRRHSWETLELSSEWHRLHGWKWWLLRILQGRV